LQRDGCAARRRAVERVDRARLADRVLPAEQLLIFTADRGGEVLELELVPVDVLDRDAFRLAVAAEDDRGIPARHGCLDECRSLRPDRLQAAAVGHLEGTVDLREDIARKAQQRSSAAKRTSTLVGPVTC
jgi:hypothetical protein